MMHLSGFFIEKANKKQGKSEQKTYDYPLFPCYTIKITLCIHFL